LGYGLGLGADHLIGILVPDRPPPPARAVGNPQVAPAPAIVPGPAIVEAVSTDGSLGDADTRLACALLTPRQIAARFGGPVSGPIPMYPFCSWRVGDDAFVALLARPNASLAALPTRAPGVGPAPDLGTNAYFGDNRFLYFQGRHASYWLLYQKVGEFTGIRTRQ